MNLPSFRDTPQRAHSNGPVSEARAELRTGARRNSLREVASGCGKQRSRFVLILRKKPSFQASASCDPSVCVLRSHEVAPACREAT